MAEQGEQKNPDGGKTDTTDYSASKAPETRAEGEERESTPDDRLIPGGAQGSPTPVGMSAMDRADVPSRAEKPEERDMGKPPAL